MNQHFNKKNIEAAIRVAMTNPVEKIYINGERSKQRYSVMYSEMFQELTLECGKDVLAWVYTTQITTSQKSKNDFVETITDVFYDRIKAA